MQKRGQKTLVSILIGVVVLGLILLTFRSVGTLQERGETVEILNLKRSIETTVLSQSARTRGSFINRTFAVPASVSEICFFDSTKDYDVVTNHELTTLFSGDENNQLFIKTHDQFFTYPLENFDTGKNPLCAKISQNTITLEFFSTGTHASITTASEHDDTKCTSVLLHGNPREKIDIVFIPFGYENKEDYHKEVDRSINNIILEFSPFKENKEKFNFFRVEESDLSCTIRGFIQCDEYKIQQVASLCPHDHIMLLVDRGRFEDIIKPVRSSAVNNIVKINTADKPFVLVHEFGHTFANLADEYIDENYYTPVNFDPNEYVNCDRAPCDSWGDSAGCFQGCSLNRYFRPTEDSIMRTLSSPTFGPVNEEELSRRLDSYE